MTVPPSRFRLGLLLLLGLGLISFGQAKPQGPQIVLRQPAPIDASSAMPTIRTATPADVRIDFESQRAPVDMDSLQVWARKGFFKKSVTHRFRPYIRGNALVAEDLKLSVGRFVIRVVPQ